MTKAICDLADQNLLKLAKNLAQNEREITIALIEHLEEIHRRRLFADLGYSSLFDYLRKELGYSDAEAGVRISSMKLIQGIPIAKEALSQGKISLTALSKVSSSIRKQERLTSEDLSSSEKEEIIAKLCGKSTREAELIIKESEQEKFAEKKISPPAATQQLAKILVTDNVIKKICQLKESKGDYSDSELIELLLDQELAKMAQAKAEKITPAAASEVGEEASEKASNAKANRYIRAKIKKEVRQRAQNRCEFIDQQTGRRCTGVRSLEFDHLRPFAVGGSNNANNLSLRCRAHNQRSAITFFGLRKMDKFFNKNAGLHVRP